MAEPSDHSRKWGGRRNRVIFAALAATATAAGVITWNTIGGQDATAADRGAAGASAGPTVTLVTGDRVTLGGSRGVSVRAADGREDMGFRSWTDVDGDRHVVPYDAAGMLSAGRLDSRLFNVTELAERGYDDASMSELPLIVDYPAATPRSASRGATVDRELSSVGVTALRTDKTADFWSGAKDSAKRIWLDGPVRATLDHSVPQIGAPEAWDAGHTGADTMVAVLDTGIDENHPDLADAVTAAKDFSDSESGTTDMFGHGTHVASIVTGSGAAADGTYQGVAPDTGLLNGKVLDDFGGGFESGIIAGMEWAAAEQQADVVNMSLGGWPTDGTDPMSQAVNDLTEQTGALFVISAGNSGPGDETVSSPGSADAALTVGAVDREDRLAEFSSRGPRVGDGAIKPDITAPGVDIVAAGAENGQIGDPVADGYVSLSGTSMAAPHVAGAAAILAGQHPDWSAEQLKASLMGSAAPNEELSVFEQGAGRVDVAAATTSGVYSTPASINNGVVQWPHDDDEPITKKVTYHNDGDRPVKLDLDLTVTGPEGQPAPEGMFTLGRDKLTVPPGKSRQVSVTTDTTVQAADGLYSGVLAASGRDTSVRTPIGVNREVESYNVDLDILDHNGEATGEYSIRFVNLDDPKAFLPHDESGPVTARLPKGRYFIDGFVSTQNGDRWQSTDFVEPIFEVTGDDAMTFDARDGKPVELTATDRPNAKSGSAMVSALLDTDWGGTGFTAYMPSLDGYLIRPSESSADAFTFSAQSTMAKPDGEGGFADSPYLYHLGAEQDGQVPAELSWAFADSDLATVRSEHAASGPDQTIMRDDVVTAQAPFTLNEFYTPDMPWSGSYYIGDPFGEEPPEVFGFTEPRTFSLGEEVTERWNVGVFGTAFPEPEFAPFAAGRLGNDLVVDLPLFSHQNGYGFAYAATGSTVLHRDGEKIGETESPGYGGFRVPAEQGTYTLSAEQNSESHLSTQVSSEWTFSSAEVTGEEPEALPLLAVRFDPELNDRNAAPAGESFQVPVAVVQNGTEQPSGVDTPAVEVSFDDGQSWEAIELERRDDRWVATVDHPADVEFVSLRASASDQDGNSVSQTILRAYALA